MKLYTALIGILLLISCKNYNADHQSSLKWGHLKDWDPQYWLINVLPNETIDVCGDIELGGLAVIGIKRWLSQIDREKAVNVSYQFGNKCKNPGKWTVKIKPFGEGGNANPETHEIQAECNDDCESTVLHESGHLFGLCDQYEGIDNCDSNNQSAMKEKNSVMGDSYSTVFSHDDILGIKRLSQRPDIEANRIWSEFLQHQ